MQRTLPFEQQSPQRAEPWRAAPAGPRPGPGARDSAPDGPHPAPGNGYLAPAAWPRPPVVVRHPRARRYLIRVLEDGTVRITVPRWGSRREALQFAERERAWIGEQLRRVELQRERPPAASLPPDVERELQARAKRELPPRLLELAAEHSLTVMRISVRNQRRRWGSCARNGHICLNWRLVRMPIWVRDYVMIHELMHLKHMNHSRSFWRLVARACPDYEAARRWLRAQQELLA
jgi:predicted metal-dependent hydrolase